MRTVIVEITQETLVDALKAIAVVADEPTFVFSSEGVAVCEMDPSRVAMVDFFLSKEAFDSYDVTDTVKMSLNIGEFKKIIGRANKEAKIMLDFQPDSRMKIEIKGGYFRSFNTSTLQATEEEMPTPKVKLTAKVTLTTDGLNKIIEDAKLVTDHIYISVEKDKVDVVGHGDLTDADINLKVGDQVLLSAEVKEQAKASFSLSYLSEILSAVKHSEVAYLHLSTDMPLKLEFSLDHSGKLEYWLAPRIEVE